MDLNEAITHAREVAEGCSAENRDCAYQHDKLADWLEELKQYRTLGPIDRLRELVQEDREERCVVLPVKLHDKLYYVDKEQVRETEVESIHNWTSGRWKLSTHTDRQFTHWIGYEVDFDGIGKTVFLTREEAEAALEGMKNG